MHACTAWLDGDAVRIRLHHPARGVAKGQAAVLYDGDTVLGSATISATSAPAPAAVASADDATAGPLVVAVKVAVQLSAAASIPGRTAV